MGEVIAHIPEEQPRALEEQPQEMPKLKDLLVSMRLPHEEGLDEAELRQRRQGQPSTGFSPEIRRELMAKLAICDRMTAPVIGPRRLRDQPRW